MYFCAVKNASGELVQVLEMMEAINQLRLAARSRFQKLMRDNDIDLTIEMLEVMKILWRMDGLNQQDIVEKTVRNKASVTSIITNLESRNLISRRQHDGDKRCNLIFLTKEGAAYREKLLPLVQSMYKDVLENIPTADVSAVSAVMQRMQAILSSEIYQETE